MGDDLKVVLAEIGKLNNRFDTIDVKFDSLDSRFDSLEGKFGTLEGRFDSLEGKFETLEGRFDSLEGKFGTTEAKFVSLDGKFGTLEGKFDTFNNKFDSHINRFNSFGEMVKNEFADVKRDIKNHYDFSKMNHKFIKTNNTLAFNNAEALHHDIKLVKKQIGKNVEAVDNVDELKETVSEMQSDIKLLKKVAAE